MSLQPSQCVIPISGVLRKYFAQLHQLFFPNMFTYLQNQAKLQPTKRGWIHIQNWVAGHLSPHHEADPGLHIQWRGEVLVCCEIPLWTNTCVTFLCWWVLCQDCLLNYSLSLSLIVDHLEWGHHPRCGPGRWHAAPDWPEVTVLPVPGELHHCRELHRHPAILSALLPASRPPRVHRVPADALQRRSWHWGVPRAAAWPAVRGAVHGEAQCGKWEACIGGGGPLARSWHWGSAGKSDGLYWGHYHQQLILIARGRTTLLTGRSVVAKLK